MKSKSQNLRTTAHLSRFKIPVKFFSSQFIHDLRADDLIVIIPPKGKYYYVCSTSLATITRIICKIGGPQKVLAASSKVSNDIRTYTLTIERRKLQRENVIIGSKVSEQRNRSKWTEDEWVDYFKCVGRSQGAYNIFMTIWYRKTRQLTACKKKYWQLLELAGLYKPLPKEPTS
jgi:hypothetical protein